MMSVIEKKLSTTLFTEFVTEDEGDGGETGD